LETLKYLRLVIPGVMWWVALRPLFSEHASLASFGRLLSTSGIWNLTAAFVLGALYYILGARRVVWSKPLKKVNLNIEDRLLGACPGTSTSDEVKLREGRTLMNLFYGFFKDDPRLEEKAKRVRFNGLIWTSTVDLSTVSFVSSCIYFATAIVVERGDFAVVGLVLLGVWALAQWVLLPATTDKHITLSDEQLEIIEQYHQPLLCAELARLARGVA
jgi:hypothetical protein